MDQGIVTSLPLGWVALIAAALIGLGGLAGSFIVQRGARRVRSQPSPPDSGRVSELIKALPQAALLVDFTQTGDGRLLARNTAATQFLGRFGRSAELPLTLDAAVGRVARSRTAESLEIVPPDQSEQRLHVSVIPLPGAGILSDVLILVADPALQGGRVEVYRRLTSLIAHELRTPLTSIIGHVEILGSCKIDEEALWRRSLGFVSGEVERLARLVEDLLSLSRLDQIPLNVQSVNLRLAAEEALSALYEAAKKNGATLVFQTPPELPRVQADSDRVRQVFLNLIDNAIKYAPGSPITVCLKPQDKSVSVEVSDSGPGIAADDLPHIFEPMYRSKRAAAGVRGSGLGLTIVHTILEQHNAQITVRSARGLGTIFAFSLPVSSPQDTKPHRPNPDARATR